MRESALLRGGDCLDQGVHCAADWSTTLEPLTVTWTDALAQAVGAARAVLAPTTAVVAKPAATATSAATFFMCTVPCVDILSLPPPKGPSQTQTCHDSRS